MHEQTHGSLLRVKLWNSIPFRLGLGVLALILVGAMALLAIMTTQEARRTISRDDVHARQMAEIIAGDVATRMLAGGGPAIWSGISGIAAKHASLINAMRILVVTKSGLVKAGSDLGLLGGRITMKDNPACPGCESREEKDFPAAAIVSTPQTSHMLRVVNPIPVSPGCLNCHAGTGKIRGFVFVDFDLAPLERANRRRKLDVLGAGLASALALAALIMFLFRRTVMRPAGALLASMERIAQGDLSARTPVLAEDEVGLLAHQFNHMAGQIEDQVLRIDSARTESALLYTLVVEASKKLETTEFASGVARVIFERLEAKRTAFFLQASDAGWICATKRIGEGENLATGKEELETACAEGTGPLRALLDDNELRHAMQACRSQNLQLERGMGGLTLALPIVAQLRLIGLLVCTEIATGIRIDKELLTNLGAHLTLAAENSRNFTGAITDGLTHLRNKQYGMVRLDEAISAARRYKSTLALAMCDIDLFKRINDTYGHQAGDAVLKEVSRRIAACVRGSDVAVRYGGEEFLLILPEADPQALGVIGEKVRLAVAASPVELGESEPAQPITVSVGIAALHADREDAESLIARADRMLYRAKENGRNRVEVET